MSVPGASVLCCGRVGRRTQPRVLQARPDVRLVAIAEPTDAGKAFAARHAPDCRRFDDFPALLADPPVDLDVAIG